MLGVSEYSSSCNETYIKLIIAINLLISVFLWCNMIGCVGDNFLFEAFDFRRLIASLIHYEMLIFVRAYYFILLGNVLVFELQCRYSREKDDATCIYLFLYLIWYGYLTYTLTNLPCRTYIVPSFISLFIPLSHSLPLSYLSILYYFYYFLV